MFLLASGIVASVAGCLANRHEAIEPIHVANRLTMPMTVAVAPALNFSGSSDFDRNVVADLMASELSQVGGITVIPVSRVLAVLSEQGAVEVGSPEHARELAGQVGADAILVFAVTEYDPYDPPSVGISAQLYGQPGYEELGQDTEAAADSDGVSAMGNRPVAPAGPLASVQRVFHAADPDVSERVRRFAAGREAHGSPFAWRLYRVSQKHYLRFCCAEVLAELVGGAGTGSAGPACAAAVEDWQP